jgi:hypothetical protein
MLRPKTTRPHVSVAVHSATLTALHTNGWLFLVASPVIASATRRDSSNDCIGRSMPPRSWTASIVRWASFLLRPRRVLRTETTKSIGVRSSFKISRPHENPGGVNPSNRRRDVSEGKAGGGNGLIDEYLPAMKLPQASTLNPAVATKDWYSPRDNPIAAITTAITQKQRASTVQPMGDSNDPWRFGRLRNSRKPINEQKRDNETQNIATPAALVCGAWRTANCDTTIRIAKIAKPIPKVSRIPPASLAMSV